MTKGGAGADNSIELVRIIAPCVLVAVAATAKRGDLGGFLFLTRLCAGVHCFECELQFLALAGIL